MADPIPTVTVPQTADATPALAPITGSVSTPAAPVIPPVTPIAQLGKHRDSRADHLVQWCRDEIAKLEAAIAALLK